MMKNPNLIRRPILIKGSRVTFGFERMNTPSLTCASARRDGITRRARERGTACSIRRRGKRPKGFDELRFYAEHFDTVEVNSTFYGQPRAEVARAGRSGRRGLRVLGQAVSEVHPSADVRGAGRSAARRRPAPIEPRLDAIALPNAADSTSSARGIEPLAARASSARCSRSSRRASRSRGVARVPGGAAPRFRRYPVAVELRHRSWSERIGDTLALLNNFGAAWVQIDEPKFRFSIRQNYLPNVARLLLHAAARPERRAVVAPRQVGRSLQLPVFGRRTAGVLRDRRCGPAPGEEAVPVHQQSLLGEVGCQRRDDQGSSSASRSKASTGQSSSSGIPELTAS